MVITYYGVTCFKIQSGETVLAIDPYTKEAGLTPPRFQTDIALVTRNHPLSHNPDTLFVPVGGVNALDAEEAVHVINLIEPRIAIPMYYAFPGFSVLALHTVDTFLKEIGSVSMAEEKLTLKKKDVPQDEMKIVVLKPLASN